MSKYLCYKDTVKLVTTTAPDGYGDVEPVELTDLKCNFFQSTGFSHSNHADVINSDAYAYIDYENTEVVEKAYRLEGMYIVASPFGGTTGENWYKVNRVTINQDKLLCNQIDNVMVFLKKTGAL